MKKLNKIFYFDGFMLLHILTFFIILRDIKREQQRFLYKETSFERENKPHY